MSTVIDHINLDLDNDGNAERYDLVSGASVHIEDGSTVVINNGNATSYDVHISNFEYSEEERVVGCWTDGRPVYEITINNLSLPSKNNYEWVKNIATIPNGVCVNAVVFCNNKFVYYPCAQIADDDLMVGISESGRTITSVIVQYLKTTDLPNSFKPSMLNIKSIVPQHNYSTEEKIVGTWIDGKPIYERVVTSTNKPSRLNTVEEVYELDTNIIPISLNGMAYIDISHLVGYKSIVKMPLPSYMQSNYTLTVDINSFNKIEMLITNNTWLNCLSNWILTIKYTKED